MARGISIIGNVSACYWEGVGFGSRPHRDILETLKIVPTATLSARDINRKRRWNAMAHKQSQLITNAHLELQNKGL